MVAGGASDTGGVKPMAIAGRMVRERERLIGMTPDERAWRKQWLKDQELHHGARKVPALELELNNPIKRMYRAPLDTITKVLTPAMVSFISALCNQQNVSICLLRYLRVSNAPTQYGIGQARR